MAARRVLHRLACTLGTLLDLYVVKRVVRVTVVAPCLIHRPSKNERVVIEVDDQSRQLQALTEGLLVPPSPGSSRERKLISLRSPGTEDTYTERVLDGQSGKLRRSRVYGDSKGLHGACV
jgi:hypothetical protein